MKLTGIVCIHEHYGAVSTWRRNCYTCLLIADSISLRANVLSGVATPWHQAFNSEVNGYAGALNENRMRAVVTGGGGYVGCKLGCILASRGASVVLYDLQKPIWEMPSGVVFIQV